MSLKNKDASEVQVWKLTPEALLTTCIINTMQYTNFCVVKPTKTFWSLPSSDLFKQSFRVRLEAFVLDAHQPLDHFQNDDLETTQEQLELQLMQLQFLLNEIRMLRQWNTAGLEEQSLDLGNPHF